jgi:hypothetical protein
MELLIQVDDRLVADANEKLAAGAAGIDAREFLELTAQTLPFAVAQVLSHPLGRLGLKNYARKLAADRGAA